MSLRVHMKSSQVCQNSEETVKYLILDNDGYYSPLARSSVFRLHSRSERISFEVGSDPAKVNTTALSEV